MIDNIARPWAFWLLLLIPFVFAQAARSYADRTRTVKLAVALIRSAICVLITLELVGISFWWHGKGGDRYVCYLADVSDSISPKLRAQARDQILTAIDKEGGERSSLILFGESSKVALPFGPDLRPEAVRSAFEPYLEAKAEDAIGGKQTDVARAVSLALANFPARAQKKIVLLTDGNQTDGDALQLASAAAEQNVQICPVPLIEEDSQDVVVASIIVPERIKREEAFEIKVELRSVADEVEGRLKLLIDDYVAEEKVVKLSRGKHVEVFRRSLEEGGGHLLRAKFEADVEQPTENDSAYSYINLPGRPRALIVSNEDASPLSDALAASRFRVDHLSTVGTPRTMLGLIRYDVVVLENVSADEFGENRLRLLRDYVREFGGGLVMVGGRNSFEPGGYAGTALDEASPLSMDISLLERPSTSIVLAVDDSRSMWLHGTPGMTFDKEVFGTGEKTFTGLSTKSKAQFIGNVFKQVALSLSPRDRIGAVGMSSDLLPARWYVRPQRVTDKDRLVKEFEKNFGRRTYSVLYPTLDEARFNLFNDPATFKQILLLTDGYVASDSNYKKFAMMLFSDGVSLSTVAVGGDSNLPLLEDMARWGGGRFYVAKDLEKLADVYEKELTAKKKEALVERPVSVAQVGESELLKGLDMNLAPVLFGYVRTRPKAAAKVVLNVEGTSDPLLASWKFGSGKVVAFTSSAVGSWATLWVKDWDQGYTRFWPQLVRGVLKAPGKESYKVNLRPEGLRLRVMADVVDDNENFINQASVKAQLFYLGERGDVFSPSVVWKADLSQTAPGRYEHEFRPNRKGVYLATVRGTGANVDNVASTGAIINIPKEHLNPGPDRQVLEAVAQVTKGQVALTAPAAVEVEGLKERRRHDLGYYVMMLAALLLVAEVLVRRWPAIEGYRRQMQAARG